MPEREKVDVKPFMKLDAMMEKKSVGSQQEKPYNKLAEALMIFKEKHETKPESS